MKIDADTFETNTTSEKSCYNISLNYPDNDFICSECGFATDDIAQRIIDEITNEIYYIKYKFKFCPNCGRKVDEED